VVGGFLLQMVTICCVDLSIATECIELVKVHCQANFGDKKHCASIVAYGANRTEHEAEGYPNIVIRPPTPQFINKPFLELVNDLGSLAIGGGTCDPTGGLIMSVDTVLRSVRKGRHQINLFTSGGVQVGINKEEVDGIVEMLVTNNINVSVFSVKAPIEDTTEGSFWTWFAQNSQGMVTISDIESFKRPQKRFKEYTLRAKARMEFDIGPIKMGVGIFTKTMKEKLPSLKKEVVHDAAPVKGDKSLKREDDPDGQEVLPEDIVKGFKYGKQFVPCSDDDLLAMKYRSERVLTVLNSAPRKNIAQHWFLGNSEEVVIDKDSPEAGLWSSLLQALREKQLVLLARYVPRKDCDTGPKLVALYPNVESLTLNYLPFSEDLRDWPFAELPEPSPEQQGLTDDLVSHLTLADSELHPELTYNPMFARFCQLRMDRLVNPSCPANTEPLPFKRTFPEGIKEKLEEHFPITLIQQTEQKKRYWIETSQRANTKVEPVDVKKIRISDEEGTAATSSSAPKVQLTVGSIKPESDFLNHLEVHCVDVPHLISQMQQHILSFVTEGVMYEAKARSCLETLRKGCIKEADCNLFNDFLRTHCSSSSQPFWATVRKQVYLISDQEVNTSAISSEEARSFATSDQIHLPSVPIPMD